MTVIILNLDLPLLTFFFFSADNRRKQKRKEVQSQRSYLDFIRDGFKDNLHAHIGCTHVVISPQLALAASRFLASCKCEYF